MAKLTQHPGVFAILMWIVALNEGSRISEPWATDNALHHAWRFAAIASMITVAIMFTVEWRRSRLAKRTEVNG
ncbi:MAG: hypothetical protein V4555_10010 [Acidobacteriota bacterium]